MLMQSGGWPYSKVGKDSLKEPSFVQLFFGQLFFVQLFFVQLFFVQLSFVQRSYIAIVIIDYHVCKRVGIHTCIQRCLRYWKY